MRFTRSFLSQSHLSQLARLLHRADSTARVSLTLSAELVEAANLLAGRSARSAFIECAMRAHIRRIVRQARHRQDLAAINARADVTNRESDELLELLELQSPTH